MNEQQKTILSQFDAIRPYNDDEVKSAMEELLADRQFAHLIHGFVPWMPQWLRNGMVRAAFIGVKSPLDFQVRFMKPVVKYIVKKTTTSCTFDYDGIAPGEERYTFMSNHRDIVLDSAVLSLLLHDRKFPTTCEIGIGDNLLIYNWIKILVRLNKAFIVRRGLSLHERIQSSQLMSRYIHYAVTQKRENIWIAQRDGRAKDSNDRTQEGIFRMFAAGGEGTQAQSIMELNLTPLTISYEYDPCDYLKAIELQGKRDDPNWKKTKQDDLDSMKTGIKGRKGRVHYHASAPINSWLPELEGLPEKEFNAEAARRFDRAIFLGYRLYPGNYVALDMLRGNEEHKKHYSADEKAIFESYLQSRLDLITIENKDEEFLRTKILEMYANPVINHEAALAEEKS